MTNQRKYKAFNSEEDLVEIFIANLLNSTIKNSPLILREVDCWQGRADIVAAFIKDKEPFPQCKQISYLKHYTSANIIALLHKRAPRSKTYILKYLGLSEETINRWLFNLLQADVISITPNGCYTINEKFNIPTIELYAYEVKLSNWKRALYQASQYKGFSNYSYVVMPAKHINPAVKNIEAFRINNVGLIQVEESGSQKVLYKPTKIKPKKKSFHLIGIAHVLHEMDSLIVKH
ncbi:hypothetical protein DUZ99_15605 [Xylanibacillus composti]|uniref:Uncharacterized protein n=1 Tax=Xylanibacillus composti TaxID=1572762 RepID=A0A8J4M4N7_9BACL|nr:hypothetical protein [Xylanibacillus composti]MDT9726409.1 hypothetical protein [Xylanibacillus composti]GIQ71497.1 hypothetical protein XYCOK13_43210 [Xylanibacillus composti]